MLQKILNVVRKFHPSPIPLGRWCRTEKPLNDVKVDLANVDHCGTCANDKMKEIPIEKPINLPLKNVPHELKA